MEKDRELERAFDKHFDDVAAPEGATDAAKNYMADGKGRRLSRRRVLSAAACFVLAAALGIFAYVSIANADRNYSADSGNSAAGDSGEDLSPPDDGAEYGDNDSQPDGDGAEIEPVYYTAEELTREALTYAQTVALCPEAALFEDCGITSCTAYYAGDELMLVQLATADAAVYIELTEKVYELLKAYGDGAAGSAYGLDYLLTQSTQGGVFVSYVKAQLHGVKYYFCVESPQKDGYLAYVLLLAAAA